MAHRSLINYCVPTILALLIVGGCAKPASSIQASHVSPEQYADLRCEQLIAEENEVYRKLSVAKAQVDQAYVRDRTEAAGTVFTMLFFHNASFRFWRNRSAETDFAKLKGEHEAITISAKNQGCEIPSRPISPWAESAIVEKESHLAEDLQPIIQEPEE